VDAGLIEKLLGGNREWSTPCVVILDAEAAVKTPGPDSIMGGGQKAYAPRYASGRIEADACCLLKEHGALLMVSQQSNKDNTGSVVVKQTLVVADLAHVVGLEFPRLGLLKALGMTPPSIPEDAHYRPGMLVG